MRKLIGLSVTGALALTAPAWGQALRQQPASPAPATRTAPSVVDALANRWVAENRVPGMVIAVGQGDAAPRIAAAGRIANEATAPAADADSLWRVYSMTKPITGIAAMILVEQGKLGLDQPISDFMPAFKTMKVLVDPAKGLTSRPATRPITVRNLLTHTAGLGYNIVTKGALLDEYNRLGINPAAVSAAMEPNMRAVRPKSLEEFANRVATLPLIAEPGAKWSYSIGLDVLGRVIEVASGMPFDSFVQTRIFQPLGMTASYWTVPADKARLLATNYAQLGDSRAPLDPGATSVWLQPPSFPYGGAGLVMSARDYDRFLHMLLNGGTLDGARILKPETVQIAMSDLLPAGVDRSVLQATSGNNQIGFGAGGSVSLADQPGGPGKGTFGWAGAAGSLGWVDPTNRVRATVMINLFGQTPLKREATQAIYTDLRR
ncbi:serine hydrolase domain-containing protein [Sphingomonas xinjiangensis]|uniref:CubicO group peptidase (Beta-lactamase class C family) n=1 Tax=Sphingomonas xinjiangensis TaxID=643568 RepID=A0A840YFN3_9SPHN|nr:serine hydrolase domain-containing protein [Sphingomonas xinjiangensis]MBB5711634.1 CubicO group peptidase (beta-lactamase class C family) [Sphingomonas xinjiangensis]